MGSENLSIYQNTIYLKYVYHAIVWRIDYYKLNSYAFDFILILVTTDEFDYHDNLFESEKFEIHQNNKFKT